jgi:translocation and assembly module TamB
MLLVAFLIALLFFLFFSTFGSQLVWNQMVRVVPGLEGKWVSGSLAEGWQLRDTKWQNDYVSISLKQVDAKWKLTSLLSGQFEINSLAVDGLVVTRQDVAEPAVPDSELVLLPSVNEYISSPIPIVLGQLKLSDFIYDDPVVQVKIKSLATEANWQAHHIAIKSSQSELVDVWLKPTPSAAGKPSTTAEKAKTNDTELPEVFVPFDITLAQLDIKQGRYHQQGFDTDLMDISLQARFDGTALTVQKVVVKQDKRSAELSGKMTFIQHYLLDATLKAQAALPVVSPDAARNITLTAKGDLAQLTFNAVLEGKEKIRLQGRLKPLTNGLPFELTGDWVQLPLPASLAGLSVEKGKLDLRGSLRTYQLKLESNGKWLDFPSTHLQLVLSGTTEKLDLQRLQLGDGVNQLIVAGQLSWQKGLHWQGQSELQLPEVNRWLPDTKAS